jgi:hypothetical protein
VLLVSVSCSRKSNNITVDTKNKVACDKIKGFEEIFLSLPVKCRSFENLPSKGIASTFLVIQFDKCFSEKIKGDFMVYDWFGNEIHYALSGEDIYFFSLGEDEIVGTEDDVKGRHMKLDETLLGVTDHVNNVSE